MAKFRLGWHPPADWAPRTVLLVLGIWIFVAAAIRAWLGYLTAVSTNRLGVRSIDRLALPMMRRLIE